MHKEKKLIFLAHPRTGSMAIKGALTEIGFERISGHHTGITVKERKGIYKDFTVFCVIRNHFDAILTWMLINKLHRDSKQKYFNLEEVIALINGMEKYTMSSKYLEERTLWFHTEVAEEIIYYENLEIELRHILDLHNLILPTPFEKVNVTKQKEGLAWEDAFSYAAVKYIENFFEYEIDHWGYNL